MKIKGTKPGHNITVSYLESLLKLDSKYEITQEKWFRNITESTINIRSTVYTLKATENKRQLVYIDYQFASTNPLQIVDGKIITPNILIINTRFPLVYNTYLNNMIEAPKVNLISAPEQLEFRLIQAPLDIIYLPAPLELMLPEAPTLPGVPSVIYGKAPIASLSVKELNLLDLTKLTDQQLYDIRFKGSSVF